MNTKQGDSQLATELPTTAGDRELLARESLADRPRLTGETFYAYLRHAPGVYAFLGSGNLAKGTSYSSHHGLFDVDEDALPVGAAVLAAVALDYLTD